MGSPNATPWMRHERAQNEGYGEEFEHIFVLDKKKACELAKRYYKSQLAKKHGRKIQVEKPLKACCNTPNGREWSMLFEVESSTTGDWEQVWLKFFFEPQFIDVEGEKKHLLDASEIEWKCKSVSPDGVRLRDITRPTITREGA